MSDTARCNVCGEPMPPGGPCPKLPLPQPPPTPLERVTAERDAALRRVDALQEELELAGHERSSATEAATVLLNALGWSSGGLGSAAIEIVRSRDALVGALRQIFFLDHNEREWESVGEIKAFARKALADAERTEATEGTKL